MIDKNIMIMMKRIIKNCILLSSIMMLSSYKIITSSNKYYYSNIPPLLKRLSSVNDINNVRLYSTKTMLMNNSNNINNINNSNMYQRECITSEHIEEFGKEIAKVLEIGDVILLRGDLGAGKTTLTRGLLRELYQDDNMIVTSPSYLLDNTYEYNGVMIHHMDLYRLPTASDLSMLGTIIITYHYNSNY